MISMPVYRFPSCMSWVRFPSPAPILRTIASHDRPATDLEFPAVLLAPERSDPAGGVDPLPQLRDSPRMRRRSCIFNEPFRIDRLTISSVKAEASCMAKPSITHEAIRALATPESFARGREYLRDGAVSNLVRRGGRLTAEVEGSEPYEVTISLHDAGVADASCTCPYDWGGYCKHIVAVLLKFADEATRIMERKPIGDLLRGLDQAQLIKLLEKRAESDSELAAWIEAELATAVEASSP